MIKLINILGVVVTAALLLALHIARTEADSAEERLAALQAEIAREQGRIGSLRANIAHLEDPEYLRALARAHLGFEPIGPEQVIDLSDLPRFSAEPAETAEAPSRPEEGEG